MTKSKVIKLLVLLWLFPIALIFTFTGYIIGTATAPTFGECRVIVIPPKDNYSSPKKPLIRKDF